MTSFSVHTTKEREVVDITDTVQDHITSGFTGICAVNVLHTTTGLSIADLDPGTDLDMLDAFEGMIPKLNFRHPHDPSHVSDHILSALVGTSLTVPVEDGRLVLGTWQRVVLFEFNGPTERYFRVTFCTDEYGQTTTKST